VPKKISKVQSPEVLTPGGCGKHRYLLTFCCIIILSFKGLRKSKYELHRTKISKYELHRTKISKNKLQRIKFPDFNFIGSVLHCEKSFWGLRKSKYELHRTKISKNELQRIKFPDFDFKGSRLKTTKTKARAK
jgi:hypothetical protein